ncbi:amidohydrolase family protein [Chitinophaga sp.]|uniref:amidohydrolase family protein n=1 Tax=Chitinophaga sp. TaxID=1869181 RepID=UPI0031D79EE7
MTIDAHQHFWIFDPERDTWMTDDNIRKNFLPADLAPVLEANGVDGCVAVQADQSEAETSFLLQLAAENDFIKGVVGWVDLRSPNVTERLSHFCQYPLLKGFRHIVQGEPDKDFLLREDFGQGIAALKQFDLAYDVLIYPHQLPAAVAFAKKFPEQRLVIDHLAKPDFETGELKGWEQHIRALGAMPHVHCKLSGMVTEADLQNWKQDDFIPFLDVALEAFGPGRLMFGSDWPVCLMAASYPQVKQIVTDYIAGLSAAEQAQIMGGNAAAFYKLI